MLESSLSHLNLADKIRAALRCGNPRCECAKPNGKVHCPAHADEHPSLSVAERGGRVLIKCWAGCPQQAVITALRERGLWPAASTGEARARRTQTETRYEVRDVDGRLVAVHVRRDRGAGKTFVWVQPDGALGLGGLRTEDLPLYGVHELEQAQHVVLVEGEKSRDALKRLGVAAVATVTGANGTPSHEVLRPLVGRCVYLWPDNDEPGRAHMARVAQRLAAVGCRDVFLVEWPDAPPAGDAADFVAQHGEGAREALQQLLHQAKPYEAAAIPDLAQLLDAVAAFIRKYVVLQREQADVLALWVAHTWAIDASDVTPYVHVTSAEKRSGKTRLLEVLECVVARPWCTANASAAAIVRRVAKDCPTLLLDEADVLFGDRERAEVVRGILNSGYRRGGMYSRVVGEGANAYVEDFPTFCAKAVAGIGGLPDTVADRSLRVELKRRRRDERVARFRTAAARKEAEPLRHGLAAWAEGAIPVLRRAVPEVPGELDDRAAEISEPLLAIADLAGPSWAARARRAVLALCAGRDGTDESVGVRTLAAVAEIFRERGVDRLPTEDILTALVDRDDGPWAGWWARDLEAGRTRPPAMRLAHLLGRYGVRPTQLWIGDKNVKGYTLQDLRDALERYVAASPAVEVARSLEPAPDVDFSPSDLVSAGERSLGLEPAPEADSSDLATSERGEGHMTRNGQKQNRGVGVEFLEGADLLATLREWDAPPEDDQAPGEPMPALAAGLDPLRFHLALPPAQPCGGAWEPADGYPGWLRCNRCLEYIRLDELRAWAAQWWPSSTQPVGDGEASRG